jgi:hypothetical protein
VQDDVAVSLWQTVQPQGTKRRHNKVSDYHSGSSGWEGDQVSSRLLVRKCHSRIQNNPQPSLSSSIASSSHRQVLSLHCSAPTVHQALPSGPSEAMGYEYNYLLTPWSRVLLEKLTGSQLIKKFPAFYGTRKFVTAFKSARKVSLS